MELLSDPTPFMTELSCPAGFVPLAEDAGNLIGVHVALGWIRWRAGSLLKVVESQEHTQRAFFAVLLDGSTAAKLAEGINASTRTIESWRIGRSPLPAKAAYEIFSYISTEYRPTDPARFLKGQQTRERRLGGS